MVTLSLNCSHQRAYCSPPGDMSMDNYGGMILTGENHRTGRETCPSITLSTTNPTWIDRGLWWAAARPVLMLTKPVHETYCYLIKDANKEREKESCWACILSQFICTESLWYFLLIPLPLALQPFVGFGFLTSHSKLSYLLLIPSSFSLLAPLDHHTHTHRPTISILFFPVASFPLVSILIFIFYPWSVHSL
jgi:hypothetical protein